ncbi:group I intron-associated PD-(D/E)XK endonuclease [Halosegnis marinus]|uniref:Group I intron-associated PD-(D/E)XK endonuclease n=1 Tax=Halosegnis marinus TaxID=3034023 RepID=A0ABD5ZTV7_9EURY|nr:group I intron-associated PD-(D/E)XK endonuclease [Halosegnis sp. DT85]
MAPEDVIRNPGHVDGELAEFHAAADLVEHNCRVSYTHGLYKYDLIADREDELLRVQVKKARQDTDKSWKYSIPTGGYTNDEIDLFAGYAPGPNKVFYVPVTDTGKEFRVLDKTGENMNEHNRDLAKLIDDYTFERAFRKLRDE